MSYVIYNKETTYILQAPSRSVGCYVERYKSEGAAKAALTRLANKGKLRKNHTYVTKVAPNGMEFKSWEHTPYEKNDFAIAELSDFRNNIEKVIVQTNLMSGEDFEQPVNTPLSCDPSSETYWSM